VRNFFFSNFFMIVLAALPASASLGRSSDSVAADQHLMNGQMRSIAQAGYTVHEISSPYGEKIKEFVSPSGTVFGVSWSGPVVPDLKQLLGDYFPEFQQAAQATSRSQRRSLAVRSDRLVVESAGHMRAFHGRAYLPALLPANVTAEVVQ
jgi:hypothetical protein